MLWKLFIRAWREQRSCAWNADQEILRAELRQDFLDTVRWTHEVLTETPRSHQELVAARELWRRHLEHPRNETDPETIAACKALEAIYMADSLVAEFEPLVGPMRTGAAESAAAKAAGLTATDRPDEIMRFVGRAQEFLGTSRSVAALFETAVCLGRVAETRTAVGRYVSEALGMEPASAHAEFARIVANAWIFKLRSEGGETVPRLRELMAAAANPPAQARLLESIYESISYESAQYVLEGEHRYLRNQDSIFLAAGNGVAFLRAIGWSYQFDWVDYCRIAESTLDKLPHDRLDGGIRALSDEIGRMLHQMGKDKPSSSRDLGHWLLEQLLRVPNLSNADHMVQWRLDQLFTEADLHNISWLVSAMERRRQLAHSWPELDRHGVLPLRSLTQYCRSVSSADFLDPKVRDAVEALLDDEDYAVRYAVQRHVGELDPEGLVVPDLIVQRIEGNSDNMQAVREWAAFAGGYASETSGWRKIAVVVCRIASPTSKADRNAFYSALSNHRMRSWSAAHGEVPAVFISAVTEARRRLDGESNPDLKLYWQWMLDCAEVDLSDQTELAKEARGD